MSQKMRFTIKSFVETDAEFPGSFSLILSDPTLDRHHEVVDAKCFSVSKSLPDHISMDLDHEMTVLSTVGSGTPTYTADGALKVDGTWARTDDAQKARSLVVDGHVRYTSVAYTTLKTKVDSKGIRHIVDAELLNGTFTQIPSNTNARVLSSKTAGGGRVQSAHDALVAAGASCDGAKALHADVGRKAIVGSVEALQERVCDALADGYADASDYGYCWPRGVIIDAAGAGTVIFRGYGCPALQSDETYRQTFTDDGAVVTLTGVAEVVDIAEIVTPDADANREMTAQAAVATAKAAATTADAANRLGLRARGLAVSARAAVT